ncbi:hypothetical protein SLE2022_095420 [Rubroshorea leprosula]
MLKRDILLDAEADSNDQELSETEYDLKGEDLSVSESDSEDSFSFSDEESSSRLQGNGIDLSIIRSDSNDNIHCFDEENEGSSTNLCSSSMFESGYHSKGFSREEVIIKS